MNTHTYTLHWSISRAADTYSYNVLTMRDSRGRKVAGCNGGGYDMIGTVFGDMLTRCHGERITDAVKARAIIGGMPRTDATLYGLYKSLETSGVWIDGACGDRSVEAIANAMGFDVSWAVNRKGHKVALTLSDSAATGPVDSRNQNAGKVA